jgi:hypothetical protein
MQENTEESALTVEDILAEADSTPYHTILEVWNEVLKPAVAERAVKITPQWANRITSSYREIDFRDVPAFRDAYFDKIEELAGILREEIEADPECLNLSSPEEDIEFNSGRYMNLLVNWQKTFLLWELNWDVAADWAATELAAIAEVHRMFFDSTGLTSLLDNIKFEVTDSDRDMLTAELEDLRAAQEGR